MPRQRIRPNAGPPSTGKLASRQAKPRAGAGCRRATTSAASRSGAVAGSGTAVNRIVWPSASTGSSDDHWRNSPLAVPPALRMPTVALPPLFEGVTSVVTSG